MTRMAPWRMGTLVVGSLLFLGAAILAYVQFQTWQENKEQSESGCFNALGQGINQQCRADARDAAEKARALMMTASVFALLGVCLAIFGLYAPKTLG